MGTNELMELSTAFTAPDSIRFTVSSTRAPVTDISVRKDTWTDNTQTESVSPSLSVPVFNLTF